MKLDFEYGQGLMSANLPDNTDIFVPGETVPDPECLPQDWDTLYAETLKSIRNPIGMQPLSELAHKGSTVVIVIPDIVKGGNQPTSHRKVAIRACIDELYAAGVEKKDILLLFSNGLHPRTSVPEMKTILGDELFNEFYYSGQITSHDSEDYEHLVDLGYTHHGDHVIMNKYVYDADVAILIGHTQGNPYGGYSGGYKHCATGISHWRSIAAHHVPQVMHRAGLRARLHPQRDAQQVRPAGHVHGRKDGQEVLLLRRGAGQQEPPDCHLLRLREGDAADFLGRWRISAPMSTGQRRSMMSSSSACRRTSTTATAWAPTRFR